MVAWSQLSFTQLEREGQMSKRFFVVAYRWRGETLVTGNYATFEEARAVEALMKADGWLAWIEPRFRP